MWIQVPEWSRNSSYSRVEKKWGGGANGVPLSDSASPSDKPSRGRRRLDPGKRFHHRTSITHWQVHLRRGAYSLQKSDIDWFKPKFNRSALPVRSEQVVWQATNHTRILFRPTDPLFPILSAHKNWIGLSISSCIPNSFA